MLGEEKRPKPCELVGDPGGVSSLCSGGGVLLCVQWEDLVQTFQAPLFQAPLGSGQLHSSYQITGRKQNRRPELNCGPRQSSTAGVWGQK